MPLLSGLESTFCFSYFFLLFRLRKNHIIFFLFLFVIPTQEESHYFILFFCHSDAGRVTLLFFIFLFVIPTQEESHYFFLILFVIPTPEKSHYFFLISFCHSDAGGIKLFFKNLLFKNSKFSLNDLIKSNFFSLRQPFSSFSLAIASCTQVNFS